MNSPKSKICKNKTKRRKQKTCRAAKESKGFMLSRAFSRRATRSGSGFTSKSLMVKMRPQFGTGHARFGWRCVLCVRRCVLLGLAIEATQASFCVKA